MIKHCKSYIELSIWLLVFAVGVRFFEAVLLNQKFTLSIVCNLSGLVYDIALFLRTGIWGLLLYIVVCCFSEKSVRFFFRILFSIMLLLSLILIVFFTTSGFLLDNVLFTYSLKELWDIVESSSTTPVWAYIVMVALPALYFYVSGKRIIIHRIVLLIFAILTLSSFFIFCKLPAHTEQYNVKVNKTYFFLQSIVREKNSAYQECDKDIIEAVAEFRSYFPEHQFDDTEFPFLYKAQYQDVLSPFFNLQPDPPNIVFIIVEGLSYDNLYNDFQLMPFLDSLSKQSLTWGHCLSAASRTFGIFPALFGAAPLGEKGFMEQSPFNPSHHTLLQILQKNNYHNYLFYGCKWPNFDHIDNFAQQNQMSYLKAQAWDSDLKKESIDPSWGYEDHILFLQAHRTLNRQNSNPRVDAYLTLSTHGPWEYPRSSHFQKIVKNKITVNNKLSAQRKKAMLDSLDVYGSFVYIDWALQQLIEDYQKRNDFCNTIFIITGDHPFYVTQFAGYANYHVPLVIYSPMLKSGRHMKGVVSHRDITPTLLSLLHANYNIETPEQVTWLNTALDTSLTFNARTFSPLQLIDHSLGGVMYHNYILCEGMLEQFTDGTSKKINDPEVLQKMNKLLSLYQLLDSYILNNNTLIKPTCTLQTSQRVVVDIVDTISQSSYFAEKDKLPVVVAPNGGGIALYFDDSENYPIGLLNYKIPDNVETIVLDIEFRIFIKNSDRDKILKVVTDLSDRTTNSFYQAEVLDYDKHNQWYTFKHSITCRKETWATFQGKPVCKAYLWNGDNVEGYIDDIKVKVIVTEI